MIMHTGLPSLFFDNVRRLIKGIWPRLGSLWSALAGVARTLSARRRPFGRAVTPTGVGFQTTTGARTTRPPASWITPPSDEGRLASPVSSAIDEHQERPVAPDAHQDLATPDFRPAEDIQPPAARPETRLQTAATPASRSGETTIDSGADEIAAQSSASSPDRLGSPRKLEVVDVIRQVKGAVILVLTDPSGRAIAFRPGQYMVLQMEIQGAPVQRSYHVCGDPAQADRIAIAVERIERDRLSNFINDYTVRGDRLDLSGPLGEFGPPPAAGGPRRLVLIASGMGICPMVPIIRAILAEEPSTRLELVHGSQLLSRTLFREELAELERLHPDALQVTLVLSRPSTRWKGPSGELAGEVLAQTVPVAPDIQYLVCGPRSVLTSVADFLARSDVTPERIQLEEV